MLLTHLPLEVLTAPAFAAGDFEARAKRGLAALERGDSTRAEIELRKAVELNPDNADAHAALALALSQNKQRPEAMGEYKKALQLDRRYVEGRTIREAARKNGWAKFPAESWDLAQQDLALEVFNEPMPHQKERLALKIHFPANWNVDGYTARPKGTLSRATIMATGGKNAFDAYDPDMWLIAARENQPSRYLDFKEISRLAFTRGGASGLTIHYSRRDPRYRERLRVIEVIMIKEGQYRRAVYEAPESEFAEHERLAMASLGTLEF